MARQQQHESKDGLHLPALHRPLPHNENEEGAPCVLWSTSKLRLSSVKRLGSLAGRLPHKYTPHLATIELLRATMVPRGVGARGILYGGEGRSIVPPSRSKVNFTRHGELLSLRAHYSACDAVLGLLASLDFSGWIRPRPRSAVIRPSWVTLRPAAECEVSRAQARCVDECAMCPAEWGRCACGG